LIILQVVIIYNQLLNVFKNGTIISLVRENLLPNWEKNYALTRLQKRYSLGPFLKAITNIKVFQIKEKEE